MGRTIWFALASLLGSALALPVRAQVLSPTNEPGGQPAIFSKTQKVRWEVKLRNGEPVTPVMMFVLPDGKGRPIRLTVEGNTGEFLLDTTRIPDTAECVVHLIQPGDGVKGSSIFVVDNGETVNPISEGETDPTTGTFRTVGDIRNRLDELDELTEVDLVDLGPSVVPAAKVSDEDTTRQEGQVIEPSVFINAGLHAREWIAPECALLFCFASVGNGHPLTHVCD